MRQVLRSLVAFAALVILIGVVLGYGGALIYPLDALAHFRLHMLLLIPPLAAVALGVRHWRALWRLGVAALLAIAGLSPLWEDVPPPSDGTALTVMTANLYQDNPQPEVMRAALRAANADILVTNETTKAAQAGVTSLTQFYRYRLALSTTGTTLRTVIWSRFPMREGRLLLEDLVEPTGAHAIVEIAPGREVTILALHLAHPAVGNQGVQVEALDRISESLPHPLIVMGDFNATPWSWAVKRVGELTRARRIPGYRVTWYGAYPTIFGRLPALLGQAIDHVLVSPGIGVADIRRVVIPGSDHLGVWADLRIPDQ